MSQPPFNINIPRRSGPISIVLHFHPGKENTDMTVPASIQAFVTEMQARVPAAIAAAVAADRTAQEPAIQARIEAAVTAATAEVVQDDTDGAAALETALDAVAPAQPPA